MSLYISDVFPYLSKECQKKLELQLGIVLRNSSKKEDIKSNIIHIFKTSYIDKIKNILTSKKNHIIKQMFLEGGFIEQAEIPTPISDFPLIELNDYYYLPLEMYEAILYEKFLQEHCFILGLLNLLPEKELKYWKNWLEKETQIPYKSPHPIKKYKLPFYFYIILSPLLLNSIQIIKKNEYSLDECFSILLDQHPLNLLNECFSFYQALQKLYYSKNNMLIKFENENISIKNFLLFFLSGKLMPVFKNNQIEKIVLTKELRDWEISSQEQSRNSLEKIIYVNFKR
ncbi:MAG: hypothetical protein KatS3mg129_2139 [Leptospiraceae bacterium]|nr:MAG: hypothetical protein KatS3mg129_2139 [Leptospiraceae bacterium]